MQHGKGNRLLFPRTATQEPRGPCVESMWPPTVGLPPCSAEWAATNPIAGLECDNRWRSRLDRADENASDPALDHGHDQAFHAAARHPPDSPCRLVARGLRSSQVAHFPIPASSRQGPAGSRPRSELTTTWRRKRPRPGQRRPANDHSDDVGGLVRRRTAHSEEPNRPLAMERTRYSLALESGCLL